MEGEKWGQLTNGNVVLGGLELPESDIDGDTTLTLGFQLVKYPCVPGLSRSATRQTATP